MPRIGVRRLRIGVEVAEEKGGKVEAPFAEEILVVVRVHTVHFGGDIVVFVFYAQDVAP